MPPSERRKKITIQASQICPLCREKVHREEVLSVCPGCQAVYHRECSGELASGRCTTLGCRYSQRRTASGRRPVAPVRPERERRPERPPLTASERVLRGAMACGVTIAFLFLAVHVAKSIESDAQDQKSTSLRAQKEASRLRSVLATYRSRAFELRSFAARPAPPSKWRFPPSSYRFADGGNSKPNMVLISWRHLKDPNATSPLAAYFPDSFRRGLCLATQASQSDDLKSWTMTPQIEDASRARFLVVVRVESLRPAGNALKGAGGRGGQPSWHKPEERLPAEVVLRAYLYDFEIEPRYKGCLEVSGRSPVEFRAGYESLVPPSLSPAQERYIEELRSSGLEPGEMPRADAAALHGAYQALRSELHAR